MAADELRKGFLKLRRTVQERMAIRDQQDMSPRTLINPKSVSAAIEYFFGRSELSQVVDQTNPLAQLTHERRLSALGPGGLNRKRAGFEVRDVHISHYGRICPIETPEGTNIGLISSLSIYAEIDSYGFLITPYKKVHHKKLTDQVVKLRADDEGRATLAPADTPTEGDKITVDRVNGDVTLRARSVTDPLPVEEHRGVIFLTLTDHHDALHPDRRDQDAHGVDGGAVGAVLVTTTDPASGRHRRGLGHADELESQVPVGGLGGDVEFGGQVMMLGHRGAPF